MPRVSVFRPPRKLIREGGTVSSKEALASARAIDAFMGRNDTPFKISSLPNHHAVAKKYLEQLSDKFEVAIGKQERRMKGDFLSDLKLTPTEEQILRVFKRYGWGEKTLSKPELQRAVDEALSIANESYVTFRVYKHNINKKLAKHGLPLLPKLEVSPNRQNDALIPALQKAVKTGKPLRGPDFVKLGYSSPASGRVRMAQLLNQKHPDMLAYRERFPKQGADSVHIKEKIRDHYLRDVPASQMKTFPELAEELGISFNEINATLNSLTRSPKYKTQMEHFNKHKRPDLVARSAANRRAKRRKNRNG